MKRKIQNATNGLGCDRHLLGLYLIAVENDYEIPKLYTDPSYKKSGGFGNFVISSSCVGLVEQCGFVPPMIKDGYSIFYGIEDERLSMTISSYKSTSETCPDKLYHAIKRALMVFKELLNYENAKKQTAPKMK